MIPRYLNVNSTKKKKQNTRVYRLWLIEIIIDFANGKISHEIGLFRRVDVDMMRVLWLNQNV